MNGRKVSPEEKHKRMQLFKKGLPVKEIARRCGVTPAAMNCWLNDNGVKEIKYRKEDHKHVKCTNALSPEQCKVMRMFLNHLLLAKKLNREPDVALFINRYRKYLHKNEAAS